MEIKELTNEEFKIFSKMFKPSSIYQTLEYALTMNGENCDSFFIGLVDNNVLKAASLIIVQKINGFKYAFAPRGPLINYNDFELLENFTKALKKYLKKKDIVAIKINPLLVRNIYDKNGQILKQNTAYNTIFEKLKNLGYYHLGYNNFFEALKPRFEAITNIDLPYTKIFANIDKGFRTKIRKSVKEGIKVYHGNISHLDYLYFQTKDKYPRDLEYFKNLYSYFDKNNLIDFYYSKLDTTEYLKLCQNAYNKYEIMSKKLNQNLIKSQGMDDKSINKKLEIDKAFEKAKKELSKATNYLRDYPDGIILSAALVIKWQNEVYLIIDSYNEQFKNFSGKHLLIWKLMGRYSKLNFKTFNLGGISNIQKPGKYKGLNDFKLNFNANVYEYAGDFELITNTPLYFMYRRSSDFNNILKSK
ncbi:MAG: peptidoglycan bridge formation glycyltransferase FemA/FemB family protein [Bacilli bacterium]|nr:peptidoglycan bridge formation glycyltransferase FemA/FemB family protein [Bacilli bacterium]